MTPAQQHRAWGMSVQDGDGEIILQVGDKFAAITPAEFKMFLRCAARAYFRAEKTELLRDLDNQKRGLAA